MPEADAEPSLEELEREERRISKRRARLHDRIDFYRASGHADGSPMSPEELEELSRQERDLSKARKDLHRRIDVLRQRSSEK